MRGLGVGSSSEAGLGVGVFGLGGGGSVDAWRYSRWRCEWQEGQSHWVRRRDGGLARRKRGWSIAEVGKLRNLRECFSLALVRVALRIGHFVFPIGR